MTGIERLREFVAGISPDIAVCGVTTTSYDSEHMEEVRARLRDYLADIAGQIEREQGGRVSRMRVLSVVSDMEHHILGHEGMEDSPVVRWARELRRALGGDGHDPAKDVSVSAYDLLPEEEREAIACVRDHGGLDSVKKLLDWVVGHCSTRQQLDFDFWLSGRVMYELGFEEDMADRDEVERRLLARLMPDSWERLEEDAGKDPCGYFGFDGEEPCGKCPASGKNCEQTMAQDLVRRCRALAERERGE